MKITVYLGTAGVGKTSVAAATALVRARSGQKSLALLADPSHAQRAALGLCDGAVEHCVEGDFWASVLDVRAALDDMVRAYAVRDAERILRHPIYATLAESLSGMQELMALERIDQLRRRGFEHIVVDTEPSHQAVRILDKPELLVEFAGSQWIRLISQTYGVAEMMGMMTMGRKAFETFSRVESLLGGKLVREVLEFYSLFEPVSDGFAARAQKVVALLKSSATEFRLVTTPQKARRDAKFFSEALRSRGAGLSGVWINRVWTRGAATPAPGSPVSETIEWYRCMQAAQQREIDLVREEFETRVMAELPHEVDSIAALDRLSGR